MGNFNIGDRVIFRPTAGRVFNGTVRRIGPHEDGVNPETEYGVEVDDGELDAETEMLIKFAASIGLDLTAIDAMEDELEHA